MSNFRISIIAVGIGFLVFAAIACLLELSDRRFDAVEHLATEEVTHASCVGHRYRTECRIRTKGWRGWTHSVVMEGDNIYVYRLRNGNIKISPIRLQIED